MTNQTWSPLLRLVNDESGQGLVEYILIIVLVCLLSVVGMSNLASGLNSAFSQIGVAMGADSKP
jgi:Flp pilus assembly pilin Flp